jgi:hypothetical protein
MTEEYNLEQEKQRANAQAKKKNQMRMATESLQLSQKKHQDELDMDASLNHLVNTKEIILMDQLEKVRYDQSKQIKKMDDEFNRSNCFFKKQSRMKEKEESQKGADHVPFYARLSEKSKVIEAQQIKDQISHMEVMQYHAAYVGGKCLIKTNNIATLSKIDEEKARQEAAERQKLYDERLEQSEKKRSRQNDLCKEMNFKMVQAKHSSNLRNTVREKQSKFKATIEHTGVFATIKLPEILSGMEEKDFRRQHKVK